MKKLLSLAALLLASGLALGQTLITGDLAGRVTDPTGAAVANATVTIVSLDDASKRTITTDKSGAFRFSLLRPGFYSLTEDGSGLTASVPSVAINVGQASTINLVAKPTGSASTVEVTAQVSLLQKEDANISYTFSQQQIEALPIPGGDITNLAFSTPGVQLSTGGGYGNFSAFGLPGNSNVFTVNGSDLMDAYNNLANSGASNNVLGANELQEAAVVVNGYTGQYGRLAGAQVNYTTKSGTNQFHGNAIFYYNSSGFNANDWFIKKQQYQNGTVNAQPHAVGRQWAGSVGGPIWKDKIFFFFDDEGLRYALPGGGSTNFFPTTAFQTATLANIAAKHPTESAIYKQLFSAYTGSPNFASARVDPTDATGGCGDLAGTTVGGVTFGGVAGQTPCAAAFVSQTGNATAEQLYAIRFDINPTSKDQINFRYRHDFGLQATSSDPVNTLFSANSNQPEYDGQGSWTHTFTPNVTNVLSIDSLYYAAVFGPPNLAGALAVFPTVFAFSDGDAFATVGGGDNSYPSGRRVSQYQVQDDFSYTHGKNAFKAGYNFRRFNIAALATRAGVGVGATSFGSNTDFYNGVLQNNSGQAGADSTTQEFANVGAGHFAIYDLGVYFQDQVAVTPNLKLTASVRFDRMGNPACNGNCLVRLNASFPQLNHSSSIPYNQAILTSQRNAFNNVEAVTTQPRFGFAYSPYGAQGKTVIRGGAGLFADIPVPASFVRYLTNAPNYTAFTITPAKTGAGVTPAPGAITSYLAAPGAGSGYAAGAASNAAFQNGFASGQTLAQIQANVAAAGGSFAAPAYSASAPNTLRNPKFVEYNLEIQQAVGQHELFDLNYVGNFGTDILFFNASANAFSSTGFGGLSTTPIDGRFSTVTDMTNFGHSNYNGIVASWQHRSGGLTTAVNYTFSHALDNTSNGGYEGFTYNGSTGSANVLTQIDPLSVDRLNYGSADYDARHNLSLNYAYQTKFDSSHRLLSKALTGFLISGNLFAKSGNPYSVLRGSLAARYTSNAAGQATNGGSTLGALIVPNPHHPCGNPNQICNQISEYASAAGQAAYGFGNQARNSYRGPMYFDADLDFGKIVAVTEHARVKIGANMFNVLNHPNFAAPYNNLANANFGKILADQPPVSSPYGNFQGAGVSGRIIQVYGSISF
jgi:hypothetical protein